MRRERDVGWHWGVTTPPRYSHVHDGGSASRCVRLGPQGRLRAQPLATYATSV